MMKLYFINFCLLIIYQQSHASIYDIFGMTNGHEPRVAINCEHVPFHVDLNSGEWVADSSGVSKCDDNKQEVMEHCKRMYPTLNISNIVEANKEVEFSTWCKPGQSQCNLKKKITPYRCLVNEYEADALMVPDGCKFDHIHDVSMCLTHDHWREKALERCKETHKMKLNDYGILLSCATDLFTGVEFVCCPKAVMKKLRKDAKKAKKEQKKKVITLPSAEEVNKDLFTAAIASFQKYLPIETKGCDRSTFITKQTEMEDRHRNQIAAVVDEWDDAEKRYNELKSKDPVAAEEKMKRTLEVFRQTLAALEEESKEEKTRLRAEHADCINTQINKDKHDAMIAYLAAIEETPVSAEKILEAVRKFIQVCEHDRVHSLRHFEHVRNRNPVQAETLREDLLQHLKDLNKVVNESMALLNYLPEIAQQFGINGGGAILKPRKEMPEEEDHSHDDVDKILERATKKYGTKKATSTPLEPTDDLPVEPKPIKPKTESADMNNEDIIAKKITEEFKKVNKEVDDDDDDDDDEDDDVIPLKKIIKSDILPNIVKEHVLKHKAEEKKETVQKIVPLTKLIQKPAKKIVKKVNVINPPVVDPAVEQPAKNLGKVEFKPIKNLGEVEPTHKKHHKKHDKHHRHHGHHGHHGDKNKERDDRNDDEDTENERRIRYHQKKVGRQERSYAITAILGLSCGILVIMLIVVIAMIVRRRRLNVTRVVLSENNDDREHLVQMQKSGFENPTYKFFYY